MHSTPLMSQAINYIRTCTQWQQTHGGGGGRGEGGRGGKGVLSTIDRLSLSQRLLMYNGHTGEGKSLVYYRGVIHLSELATMDTLGQESCPLCRGC